MNSFPALLAGTWVTLKITFLSLGLGLIIALPFSFGQVYGNKLIKSIIGGYERVVRSIPGLVILFLVFYGFPEVGIRFSPFVACFIGLGIRSSAYQSQIFRGAIQSVSTTQMRAARSLGMTSFEGFRYVVLPQAARVALPPWTNEFTIVLKDSSFAFALGVTELLRQGRYIISTQYEPMLIYLTVAGIYLFITLVVNRGIGSLEKRLEIPGFSTRERIR